MNVVPIRKKQFLGDYCAQCDDIVAGDVKFMVVAGLTLLAPTFMYCAVTGQWLPLCLMACDAALGVVLGVVMFKKSSAGFLSCVPVTYSPNVSKCARINRQNAA